MATLQLTRRLSVPERLRRYATLVIAIAVGLLAALGLSLHQLWQRDLADRAEHSRVMATAAIGHVDRNIERADRVLEILSAELSGASAHRLAAASELRASLDRIRAFGPLIETLGIVAIDGRVIAASIAPGGGTRGGLESEVLQAHREASREGLMISGPFRRDDGWNFVMSRALRGADDAVRGVVFARVNVRMAVEALEPLRPARGGNILILSDRFAVLAGGIESAIGADLGGGPIAAAVRAGGRAGVVRLVEPTGGQIAGYVVSARSGLVAASLVPEPDLIGDWVSRNLWALACISALILGGLVAMIWLVAVLRRDAEQDARLRESTEAALRDSIESMGEGFVLWDRHDRLVTWNRRFEALMPHARGLLRPGILATEFGLAAARLAFPHMSEAECREWHAWRRQHRANPGVPFELQLAGDRTVEAVEHATSEGGRVVIYRDVTAERRALRELRESEARFRDGIESMGEGFVLWDRNEKLVVWNRRYTELLPHVNGLLRPGIDTEEVRAEAARRAFPHLSEAELQDWLERRRQHRARPGVPFELQLVGDRTVEAVEHTTSEGGRVVIYRDVTAERRALRELRESEARFRDGIESIADGFILWDPQDRVASWNRRCKQILPYAGRVLRIGMPFEQYVRESVALNHPEWTDAQRRERVDARIDQHRARNRTSEFETADGRTIEVRETPTSNGGCVSLFRDITAERRLLARLEAGERELQRALVAEREVNAQQRRFVSMASHEFRTPLAIIDSTSQRILAHPAMEAQDALRQRVDRIRAAVTRMTEIIERTLSTARLDDGRFEFQPAACDLVAIITEVCERQRSISSRHEIRLALPTRPVPIEADPRLLDQIVTNLVSNAVKYSAPATVVEVAAREDGDTVEFSVVDHGMGIPAAEIDRLFTRFFRASTTLSIPGTGIGLHLVKEFVTLHGGTISVRSEERRGSTFTVRLPRRAPVALPESRAVA